MITNTKDTNVSKPDCELWAGLRDRYGYGIAKIKGKNRKVHRLVMMSKLGRRIEPSELVLHSCGARNCINPSHLRLGTVADNARDRRLMERNAVDKLVGGIERIEQFL